MITVTTEVRVTASTLSKANNARDALLAAGFEIDSERNGALEFIAAFYQELDSV